MKKISLFKARHLNLFPGAEAFAAGGEKAMVMHVRLEEGAVVPKHAHPQEQISVVLSGRVVFEVGEEVCEAGAGEAVFIPGDVPHTVQAILASEVLDVFAPPREDLKEKFPL